MAKNITLMGASYTDVPAVTLPQTGGGTASFTDVTDTTATASDVAQGKVFYAADGNQTIGTASGGGESPWTLIDSQEIAVSTTATSAKAVATIAGGSAISTADKIVWVHIRDKAGERAGYFYGSDAFFINYIKANDSDATFTYPAVYCIHVSTSGTYESTIGQYGVYGYSISNEGSLIIRRRYSSTTTLTIDGTFQVDVYTLDLPDGLTLFD